MKRIIATVAGTALVLAAGSALAHPRKPARAALISAAADHAQPMHHVLCAGVGWAYGGVLYGSRDPDPAILASLGREFAGAGAFPGEARAGETRCEGTGPAPHVFGPPLYGAR